MQESQKDARPLRSGDASTLERVQAASGVFFGLFLVLHLITTISAVGGAPAYDRALSLLRNFYRPHLMLELLLVALSGTVHIGCAVAQMAKRRRATSRHGPAWVRAHRLSGYFLLLAVAGHTAATRVLPAFGTGPTATGAADFAYLAYSLLGWPWFFRPYYLLLGTCGAIHLGLGVRLALPILIPERVSGATPSRRYLLAVCAFAVLVMIGIGAIIARSPTSSRQRFSEYGLLYQRVAPFLLRHRADHARVVPPP